MSCRIQATKLDEEGKGGDEQVIPERLKVKRDGEKGDRSNLGPEER